MLLCTLTIFPKYILMTFLKSKDKSVKSTGVVDFLLKNTHDFFFDLQFLMKIQGYNLFDDTKKNVIRIS